MKNLPIDITDYRIAACIRACNGIATEILADPGYSIKAELDSLDEQISRRLKAELDLEKLKQGIK